MIYRMADRGWAGDLAGAAPLAPLPAICPYPTQPQEFHVDKPFILLYKTIRLINLLVK